MFITGLFGTTVVALPFSYKRVPSLNTICKRYKRPVRYVGVVGRIIHRVHIVLKGIVCNEEDKVFLNYF